MGSKAKKRHRGRSARKRVVQLVANTEIQWVRLEKANIKQYRLSKRIAWRKTYHSHEKRAFTTSQPNKGRAMVKCGPVVYHVTALVEDRWETKHFSTRSIKSTRIKGLHSVEYAMPTIGNSGTIAADGSKSKVCRESRRIVVVGNSVHFLGFDSDDVLSLGIPRGNGGFKIGNGYIAVDMSLIGVDKLRKMQSFLSASQF